MTTLTKTPKFFLARLFEAFDGENQKEKKALYQLGFKAENNPEALTKKEIWKVALFINDLQSSSFRTQLEVIELEEIKHNIFDSLGE